MGNYALINGILLDGTEEMIPTEGKVIFIEGEKITAVTDSVTDMSGFEIIDLNGHYIMPGLINMHVHLAGNGKPQKKQRDNAALVKFLFGNPVTPGIAKMLVRSYARLELLSGVTTIRTVGGLRDLDAQVRDEIQEGKWLGPRILAGNEGISVPGGHMAGSVAVAAESPEEIRELVRKGKRQKADHIKLMVTGGVLDAKEKGVPGELKMPPEMIKAACEEAHKNGYLVVAHVESPQGLKAALENGVDSVEHGAAADEEIIRLFQESGAFLTTTLSPALPYALFDRTISNASEVEQYNGDIVFKGIIDCAKTALKHGIPVALGNDVGCPWVSQYDFWRELVYFCKFVGVSRKFALHTATLQNARLAGIGDITGSIEAGKAADMIVCAENPLEDLGALRHVELVVTRGNLIRHPKVRRNKLLDRELDKFC